ncbi:hypothetical protein C427_5193 [Paraglaciecola psychrophila 170]|uniref:Uncharacterized protein n=1 Tax=Paraglaciecola psychrophila 170 TaxID=1129794 RepID=K7A451_9ALTE|nr:hypothetical protein C427_5193 [Paraglaciecola psychrophila 170]GAC35653.1 hypothetical protein GPSY_0003 [Paraglaciecola psychrophila 170]
MLRASLILLNIEASLVFQISWKAKQLEVMACEPMSDELLIY